MAEPVEKPGSERTQRRSVTLPAIAGGAGTYVGEDLACQRCGYNLRGLGRDAHCPECDAPVAHALRGDWLRYSSPDWVATIAKGYVMQSMAVLLGMIALILVAAASELLLLPWLTLSCALTIGAVALVGVWQTTAREPAAAGVERRFSDRRMLRALTILGIALQAGAGFVAQVNPTAGLLVRLTAAGVMFMGIICAFRLAISLAERVPDVALANETRIVLWGMAFSFGLTLSLFAVVLSAGTTSMWWSMAFCSSCFPILGCLVFTVWSFTLFFRYAAALRTAAHDARALVHGPISNATHSSSATVGPSAAHQVPIDDMPAP